MYECVSIGLNYWAALERTCGLPEVCVTMVALNFASPDVDTILEAKNILMLKQTFVLLVEVYIYICHNLTF